MGKCEMRMYSYLQIVGDPCFLLHCACTANSVPAEFLRNCVIPLSCLISIKRERIDLILTIPSKIREECILQRISCTNSFNGLMKTYNIQPVILLFAVCTEYYGAYYLNLTLKESDITNGFSQD